MESIWEEQLINQLTKSTESLAAMAKISAHDTTPLHWRSTAVFIASITSNPRAEFRLGAANFSLSLPSNNTDASQPYNKEGDQVYNNYNYQMMNNLGKKMIVKLKIHKFYLFIN